MSRMCDAGRPAGLNAGLRWSSGYALVMVMVILTIVSALGAAGLQLSVQAGRGARNDRDFQLAWQSAEAALADAEIDIHGPGASSRRAVFSPSPEVDAFIEGCGDSGNSIGLCKAAEAGKPAWLLVDFEKDGSDARTVPFGRYTGRAFASGKGLRPAKPSRYVIELLKDPDDPNGATCSDDCLYLYRVTAMGFGPRADIQAVLQMVYRI